MSLFLGSCQSFKPHSGIVVLHSARSDAISIRSIAVLPFRSGSLNPPENGTVICHLTGQSFRGGNVEPDSGKNVASLFYHGLLSNRAIRLISETDVNILYESMDKNLLDAYSVQLGKSFGDALKVDAVLMGVVLRYEERDGTSWAVNRPASAAFTAVLIDAKSGDILWKIRFDKAQEALSENILNIKNFLRGGGSWQTVDQLLSIGIEDALQSFPIR
jgi:TolB-like protein